MGRSNDARLLELIEDVLGILDLAELREGLLVTLDRAVPSDFVSIKRQRTHDRQAPAALLPEARRCQPIGRRRNRRVGRWGRARRRRRTMSADATATTAAWVYLLRCADGSLYCGWTVDVERRVRQHQAGHASRYTRTRLPVTLAFVARMETHQAARREEARIKRLTRIEKLALITPARVGSQAWLENTS